MGRGLAALAAQVIADPAQPLLAAAAQIRPLPDACPAIEDRPVDDGCGADAALPPAEVARRFRWARRQGNPAWLWPEVSVERWRAAMACTEAAVRSVLAGEAGAAVLSEDAEAIGLAGYTCGVGPLLGCWIEQGRLSASPAVAAVLALHLRHNRRRAARLGAAAAALVGALADQGVEAAVLKGSHTAAAYFPEPGARPASDIDLLVRAGDLSAAEAVMGAAGLVEHARGPRETSWRPADAAPLPRSLMLVHADDPWSVDLHGSLDQSAAAGARLARLDAADPMASRTPWTSAPGAGASGAVVLEQPLLLLHLAVHAGAGLQSLTLLRLVELILVIRQDRALGALSWAEFLAMGEHTGALGYAYPALRMSEALAPGVVPPAVLQRCATAAPAAVVRLVQRLTPATAQRIDRASMAEHFMWSDGWAGGLRQLAADLAPPVRSWRGLWSIYEARAWRLLRGRFSR